jgi:anti-sigma regulatory factor (Ser/Thr protein kinase)
MSEVSIEVRADGSAMAQIRGLVERFAAECTIAHRDVARVLIAVEELVTNVVRHGYDAAPGTLRLTLRLEGARLLIAIVDDARPFDPFAQTPPDLDAPIEERRVGGLGLPIIKSLMDRTNYRRDGTYNVVEISRPVAFAK